MLGINHMVANTQILRILILTDAGAQLKTFWNVFDRIELTSFTTAVILAITCTV